MLELMPTSRDESLRLMAEMSARAHEQGVYSHLLSGGTFRSRTLALWSSMHDPGRLTSTQEPNRLRIDLVDYALRSPEMCIITEAYLLESLRMSGMVPVCEKLSCAAEGGGQCTRSLLRQSRAIDRKAISLRRATSVLAFGSHAPR